MKPLSEAKLTFFSRLLSRKHRYREGMFLAEGYKLTREAIQSGWKIEAIIAREGSEQTLPQHGIPIEDVYLASERAFSRLTEQESPEGVITVVRMPAEPESIDWTEGILLDGIQDPGNAGTILRLADWCGLSQVYCLDGTVDMFSPKVVRASMGSIFRIRVTRCSIDSVIHSGCPVFLADMHGTPVTSVTFPRNTIIGIGNEATGISLNWPENLPRITIPGRGAAESLNAAIAAAMICYEWKLRS